MKRIMVCAIAALLLSGCATMFSGPTDIVTFNSYPEGAEVEIDGAHVGITPVTVPVKRSMNPPEVFLKLEGYESQYVSLQHKFNGVSALNILFFPGFFVDKATGAMRRYEVLHYETELGPIRH
jgi:hypothetical protein